MLFEINEWVDGEDRLFLVEGANISAVSPRYSKKTQQLETVHVFTPGVTIRLVRDEAERFLREYREWIASEA